MWPVLQNEKNKLPWNRLKGGTDLDWRVGEGHDGGYIYFGGQQDSLGL